MASSGPEMLHKLREKASLANSGRSLEPCSIGSAD